MFVTPQALITGWASIIAIPTFITGLYGINVPYPGFGEQVGFYSMLAITIASSIALYVVFRRKGWL